MEHGKQTKIAKKIGVTPQLINQILNGKRPITWEVAKKLSEISGKPPFAFMEEPLAEIKVILEEIKV